MGTRLSHFSMIQNKAKITANMNQKLKHKLQHEIIRETCRNHKRNSKICFSCKNVEWNSRKCREIVKGQFIR